MHTMDSLNKAIDALPGDHRTVVYVQACIDLIAQRDALAAALRLVYDLRSTIVNEANRTGSRFTPGSDRRDAYAEAFEAARAALARVRS
jgi:hypothetical protein